MAEWPWRHKSRSKIIAGNTPSHASDHLYLIWKESIENCRYYRVDTPCGTDGQTDGVKPIYPNNFVVGIKIGQAWPFYIVICFMVHYACTVHHIAKFLADIWNPYRVWPIMSSLRPSLNISQKISNDHGTCKNWLSMAILITVKPLI